jgi:3-oxoacyl-[acyl-carrier-protein] synthase II
MTGSRRVVVTGLGTVSAAGTCLESFWKALFAPAWNGHRRIEGWDPQPWLGPRQARRTARVTQFAVAAAELAMADAGTVDLHPERCGVWFGAGLGGTDAMEEQTLVQHDRGDRRVSPFVVPMVMLNAAAAAVSMRLGLRGPCETTATACAASTHAIGNAARLIASGVCDTMLAGGAEACMTPTVLAGFANMQALSPSARMRPFDVGRDGFAMAEGAAVLVLEERDRALARGAAIYGEVLGSASTADAYDVTQPHPDSAGAIACIRGALAASGLAPGDVAQINAHGTSTTLNDLAEARAIRAVFGAHRPAVTSTKGATGHALGAAGALEAVAVLLSMRHRVIPPTVGLADPDPDIDLDLVTGDGRAWEPGPALSFSLGFGGHNGVLALGPAR